ncbi:MAG TPA: heat-inducible transcriptional repressor HrcA [Anaerolineaceae bacterium]|nr:heat-inducible transcriptional repressor HrcA [Anaerolineaceae bacterium]HPN51317.1 heat-inducible transcriptional repressor HrcA [Anaerolineaceae bacterium]
MNDLTDRQKLILTLVIHEYIKSAQPIGSQYLVERFKLDMSSATVRNEMSALTEMGYLRQPHTSAGRSPTEEGYRYFVGNLAQRSDLPENTRRTITHQFYQSRQDVEQWLRLAASVLAYQSRAASLVTAPHPEQARFKHLELIATRGRQVLLVLVLVGGDIQQQIITLAEPVSQEQLSAVAAHLTQVCQNLDAEGIRAILAQSDALEKDVLDVVMGQMSRTDRFATGDVYLDGLTNVLAEPEFSGSEDARRALRLLEERSLLDNLLSRTVMTISPGGVQVLIGGEGTWDELRQCSVVLARYGLPGFATGTLGVLGPMRMSYGHTISTVRFISALLSDLMSETLVD